MYFPGETLYYVSMTNDTVQTPTHCEHRTQIQITDGQAWADCAHCWDAGQNVHPDDR